MNGQWFVKIFLLITFSSGIALAQEHNKLTPEEEKAGYSLLFNGIDLDNWHAYREQEVTDAWSVETSGPLGVRIENGSGRKRPILTNEKFMNFDLKIDVQTPVDGNSGIFVRYEEEATSPGNTRSGPETQICGPSDGDCKNPIHMFGCAYDMFPVVEELRNTWYNTPGQWNQLRIIAYDSNYAHYGNGKKLLEYKIGTPEFIAAYNRSKYISDGNNGNYYDIHPGGILLQHHGEEGITFRNIKARELKTHPFKQEFPDGQWPEAMDQSYVFGKRGCTDPTKANYDATAEVDDSSCITPVWNLPEGFRNLKISNYPNGNFQSIIMVSHEHKDFEILDLSGKSIPHQKVESNKYSIDSQFRSGIIIARMKVEGVSVSEVLKID